MGKKLGILTNEEKVLRVIVKDSEKEGKCNKSIKIKTGLVYPNNEVNVKCGSWIWLSRRTTVVRCKICIERIKEEEIKRRKEKVKEVFDHNAWKGDNKVWLVRIKEDGICCKPIPVLLVAHFENMVVVNYINSNKEYLYDETCLFKTYSQALLTNTQTKRSQS